MPTYLMIAYVIFCIVPLILGFSIAVRRRQVHRSLEREQERTRDRA